MTRLALPFSNGHLELQGGALTWGLASTTGQCGVGLITSETVFADFNLSKLVYFGPYIAPGGAGVTRAMVEMVESWSLRCGLNGERTHDRCVGVCYLEGADIAAIMVARGSPATVRGSAAAGIAPRRGKPPPPPRARRSGQATRCRGTARRGDCRRATQLLAQVAHLRLRLARALGSITACTAMASDQLVARDAVIRQAAFDHVRALQSRDLVLSHAEIAQGFLFEGERWPLVNPQRGIFKPRGMPFLLSIRTVFPRKGGRVWYDDQRHVHRQIFAGDDELDYAFMGTDPSAAENVWLREAAHRQTPFIYFLGVSPGRYQAIVPTFVFDWDPRRLNARIAFGELAGATATATVPDAVERRYALRLVKQRLHQASFRDSVLAAYDHRCAISNLPDDHLLDAAHIMADAHELLGQPVIVNGIALSKIHHAAFDNHLIGIDPDGRVHVSERLLRLHDGPLLEQSLKAAAGALIRLPKGKQYHPDRDRLAARFELFHRAA